jgi:hypothetical protein
VELEEAITYHAKQLVAWSVGQTVREFRGGYQRNGERSRIATKSILAIKGSGAAKYPHAPSLTNSLLFARDRHLCAYCGDLSRELSRDHESRWHAAGRFSWITPSPPRRCNTRKGRRTPSRRGYLLSSPYVRTARLSPAQPPHPRRPDGIPSGVGVEEQRLHGRARRTGGRARLLT